MTTTGTFDPLRFPLRTAATAPRTRNAPEPVGPGTARRHTACVAALLRVAAEERSAFAALAASRQRGRDGDGGSEAVDRVARRYADLAAEVAREHGFRYADARAMAVRRCGRGWVLRYLDGAAGTAPKGLFG